MVARDSFWRRDADLEPGPRGRVLLDHWHQLRERNGGGLPPRTALSPVDLKAILAELTLVAFDAATKSFRYRLIGTGITEIAGRDATGRMLDQSLYGPRLNALLVPYRLAVRAACPVITDSPVLFADRWFAVRNTFAPFRTSGDGVGIIAVHVERGEMLARPDIATGRLRVLDDA